MIINKACIVSKNGVILAPFKDEEKLLFENIDLSDVQKVSESVWSTSLSSKITSDFNY